MFDLKGAVAVVTGATRGIGKATAVALGRAGANVVVVGRTSETKPNPKLAGTLEGVCAEMTAEGLQARPIQADLRDAASTQAIVDKTLEWFGRCDVLVNNAAYTANGPIDTVPWSRWETSFRLQVVAPMQLCQGFVPGMIERGSGRVLNVSSGASLSLTPNLANYSVSKQAMERWNEYMNLELGGKGVSFNTLRVDRLVATEGWYYVYENQGEEIATAGQGMSSMTQPEEAAGYVLAMINKPSDWSGHALGYEEAAAL